MTSIRARRRSWILFVPVALGVVWISVHGYQGLNGQDAHDYLRIARAWTGYFQGWAGRPVMAEHPHGFPMLGALLGLPFGSELAGLRLVGLAAYCGLLFTMLGILKDQDTVKVPATIFVLLSLAISPFLLRYSLTVMSDVPGMAMVMLTFFCLLRWRQVRRARWLVLALCCAGIALTIRLATVPIILGAVAGLVQGEAPVRVGRWMVLSLLGLALCITTFALLWSEQWAALVDGSPLAEWSLLNLFRSEHRSDDGTLIYRFPNLVHTLGIVVHPGTLPIGPIILPFFRWQDLRSPQIRLAAWSLMAYLPFISGMPFQNDRVLLMALPFVVILLYPAFLRAWDLAERRRYRPGVISALLATAQFLLFLRAVQPFMDRSRMEVDLAAEVSRSDPPRVYTHGMGAAFSNYCGSVPVTELWYDVLEDFEHGALVVVQPDNLGEQWTGLPPAINWDRMLAQGLDTVGVRADGWLIARLR